MFTNLTGVWALANLHEGGVINALQQQHFRQSNHYADIPEQVRAASGFTIEKYFSDLFSIGAKNDVVRIPVYGTMTRSNSWDNVFSNEMIISLLANVADDDTKKGAILDFFTGGGTVDSLDEFAAQLQATMGKKPVVALANVCLSAGYYVASQCSEVIMRPGPTCQIGSIGTIFIHMDITKALEQQGIKPHILRSTGSVDKAKPNDYESLDAATTADMQKMLDLCNRQFKGAVRTGRGAKLTSDAIFTGKIYGSSDAKGYGMIDRTGDLTAAYNRVLQLSKNYA